MLHGGLPSLQGNAASWIKTTLMLEEYLDGPEVDVDLVISDGQPVYGAITDNWPTIEPYFNETGSNCPSILPIGQQRQLIRLAVQSVQSLGLSLVTPRLQPTSAPLRAGLGSLRHCCDVFACSERSHGAFGHAAEAHHQRQASSACSEGAGCGSHRARRRSHACTHRSPRAAQQRTPEICVVPRRACSTWSSSSPAGAPGS